MWYTLCPTICFLKRNRNKIIQQRLKDIEANRDQSNAAISDKIVDLERQLNQALGDKELALNKSMKLTENNALKDRQLTELQKQLKDLEHFKDWQEVQTEQTSSHGVDQQQIK